MSDLWHFQYSVVVYLYALGGSTKMYWDPHEMIELWPISEYASDVLDRVPPETAVQMGRCPFQIQQWKEKPGDELKDW